ncbi:YHYH domain-containing protein [Inquilinus limosus]
MLKTVLGAACLVVLTATAALAHSGGTDANGCHQDHKNGGYHCHGKPRR